MKKKILRAFVLVAMSATLIVGCGSKEEGKKANESQSSQEKEVTVKIGGTGAVVSGLDCAIDWNGWYTVRYGVGETLFKLDENLSPSPWLAKSYEQVDDKTLKVTLKENVTFSNGEKVSPEKVIASLKRSGEMNDRATSLKEAEYSVDGNDIIIKSPEVRVTLLNDLCDPYAAIIDVENTKDFDKAPIGTGPFVVDKFELEKKADLVKNDKYWDGQAKVDKVEYIQVADANTLAMSLQTGEIDIAIDLTPEAAASLSQDKNITVDKTVQPRVYQLYFHLEKMTDKAVREAIMYGIDKETIGNELLKGNVTPAKGAFLEDSDYNSSQLETPTFDKEKAKSLLKEAGYEDTDNDDIVDKDKKPLKVELSIYKRLAMEAIATQMQAQLKEVGIQVEIKVSEKSTYFAPGDFEMGLYSIVTTPTGDPYAFLRDALQTDGVANYGKYSNEKVDAALLELNKTFDGQKRVDLVNEIQQQAINDAAFDVIGFHNMSVAYAKTISGYKTSPNDYYQVTKDLEKK